MKEHPLTDKILNECFDKSTRAASANAMKIAGSIVIARDGWIVRLHADGRIDRIKKLEQQNLPDIAI